MVRERVAQELTLSRMSHATLGTIYHQTETLLQEALHRIEYSFARPLAANINVASSSPGELHPQALTEPDVNLSAHPAPIVQSQDEFRFATGRTSSVRGGQRRPTNEPRVVHGERTV